ncbi:MAG: hypothetical protein JWP19_2231 [Rhodoglobus sp.]|nr:hypothetical protein [Rhodoglobus sp.]
MVEVRLMLPTKRFDAPEWEIKVDGKVVGWVAETHIGRKSRVLFYEAHALHPETGMLFSLNLSTDREERVQAVLAFHANPVGHRGHEVSSRH